MLRTFQKDYFAREVYRQNGKFKFHRVEDLEVDAEDEKEYIPVLSLDPGKKRRRIVTSIIAKATNYWWAEVYLDEEIFCVIQGEPYQRDHVYPTALKVNDNQKLTIKFFNPGNDGAKAVDIDATVEFYDEDLYGVCLEN